ncbi:MAG: Cys-tRNA(Pro) deacylase [Clostridia bacterium]|nr:Cys-tRNA(Pro) deacylase [Clostridia bacterium]
MRILDAAGVRYAFREYDEEITDGESVASAVGVEVDRVFKTLVTIGSDLEHYVFVVPVNFSLDLKKAAASVGVKRVEMIKQKELLPLTGYVHGGCSPFGMKKKFVTVVNDTATLFDSICVSGGKRGLQIELSPDDIVRLTEGKYADLLQ